jgi:hypothetical protein
MGVHRTSLYNCALGKSDICAGYHWEYVGEEKPKRQKPEKPENLRRPPSKTIEEVQEEAARRTLETGRRVRYADIQKEETVALIRGQDTLAKLKLEKLKRRAKK